MPVSRDNASEVVRYHKPTEEQIKAHEALAVAAEAFIVAIFDNTPKCADQTAAIRHVREAKMTASAAVALDGMV